MQKDKQRTTKHTHKTKDLVARTQVPRTGKFEDTKGIIRNRKSKKDIQHNDQMEQDNQRSMKHYTEK